MVFRVKHLTDVCLFFPVTVEGSYEGRVFDQRELKFEVGDGESLGFPTGVEKAIMAMEEEEEALFVMKPKYDPYLYHNHASACFVEFSLIVLMSEKNLNIRPSDFNCLMKPSYLL